MGTLVNRIPYEISGRGSGAQGQYIPTDLDYDYAIGGIPFVSAIKDEFPYTERMSPIRKDQFDSFAEPGEQSLQGWWLRSQSTFTGGAGVLYQDPDNDNQFNYRFADSLGIDPWHSGDMRLLRRTERVTTTAATSVLAQGYVDPTGVDSYWLVEGGDLTKKTDAGSTNISIGGTTILDITSTGATYIIARTVGVWKGLDTAAPTQLYTDALTNPVVEFVKDRLIITNGVNVYQGVLTAAAVALPAASYSHPDPNWQWRSITDGPTAVYIAGDSGTTSQIHKFSVIDNAGVPQFKWAGVTATMPAGEIIRTIYSYVESFVGIATNKGFRVGEIDSNGDVSYGPLIFEATGGARGIVGNDRFMWVGTGDAHDGDSGLYRVDLGNSTQEQTTRTIRYAYARDIYGEITDGLVNSVTMFGASDRKVFTIPASGSFRERATELLPTGYLKTGRIRFNTEEPKLYKFFSVRTPSPLTGSVSVSVLPEGGGEIPYITYSGAASSGTKDVATPQPVGPQNWFSLKFILTRDSVTTSVGGVLNGWQVKALPGSIRQRIITVPVLLYDNEKDRAYQSYGYDGFARERLEQFKSLARSGDTWLFQELAEDLVTEVVIDDWEFKQDGPPAPAGALGGVLTMVLRTVAEST
jgi:hypothetical protein